MFWWQEMGYPPFKPDNNGFPRIGEVIKHYREGEGMKQSILAKKLGIETRQMKRIENEDAPVDDERRRIICKWLPSLPPILLGIVTLEEISRIIEQENNKIGPIDIGEHRAFLEEAHNLHQLSTAVLLLNITKIRLKGLYSQFAESSNRLERPQIYEILFNYHILIGLQLRELQEYEGALTHITIAGDYANTLNSEELKTIHYLHYIRVLDVAGSIREAVLSFDVNRLKHASPPLASMGFAYVSTLYARVAATASDKSAALRLAGYSESFVRSHPEPIYVYGLDSSQQAYHIRKAHTQINVGQPTEALYTLDLLQYDTDPWICYYRDLYTAQAYQKLGNYGVVVSCAEECLKIARKFSSPMNVARVQTIHDQLVLRGYNGRDLTQFGRMLKG